MSDKWLSCCKMLRPGTSVFKVPVALLIHGFLLVNLKHDCIKHAAHILCNSESLDEYTYPMISDMQENTSVMWQKISMCQKYRKLWVCLLFQVILRSLLIRYVTNCFLTRRIRLYEVLASVRNSFLPHQILIFVVFTHVRYLYLTHPYQP